MTVIQLQYINNHLAIACSEFNNKTYESDCIKELIELSLQDDFKYKYNYAIYTDTFLVPQNIFVPSFHLYYLTTERKDVIILDDNLLEIPSVYNHHNFYTYNDEELLKKLQEKHPTLTFKNINSIKDINNVQTNE
jgi:hypothetical protein